ncbi:MAG: hypothetical protein V4617_03215 [Gemmatimonadota bacterium]
MQTPVELLQPNAGLNFLTALLLMLGVVGGSVALLIYFVRRFLRAYEKRATPDALSPTLATVEALETDVAQLRSELAHLAEGQAFTAALLSQRPAPQTAAAPSVNSSPPPPGKDVDRVT